VTTSIHTRQEIQQELHQLIRELGEMLNPAPSVRVIDEHQRLKAIWRKAQEIGRVAGLLENTE
jgi:hypothetical protein